MKQTFIDALSISTRLNSHVDFEVSGKSIRISQFCNGYANIYKVDGRGENWLGSMSVKNGNITALAYKEKDAELVNAIEERFANDEQLQHQLVENTSKCIEMKIALLQKELNELNQSYDTICKYLTGNTLQRYIEENVDNFKERYDIALSIINHYRCNLEHADRNLYDDIVSTATEYAEENELSEDKILDIVEKEYNI